MIGLFLGKRLGLGFKIVSLLLTLIFFVSCAGTDPNGNNGNTGGGGNNGGGGNPPPPTVVDCTGTEPNHPNNPDCILTGTEGLTEITDDTESVEVKRLIALGGASVGQNEYWEISDTSYPVDGHKPNTVDAFTGLLRTKASVVQGPFSFNMKVGSDKKLYLFTISSTTYNFTFDLLFVKTVNNVKYSVTVNGNGSEYGVKYNAHGYTDNRAGTVRQGITEDDNDSVYYDVYPELPTDAITSLKTLKTGDTVDIYMIVHKYGGWTSPNSLKGKNVIRIK